MLNPPAGYIVTANNAAAGPDGPMLTKDWDYGYRAAGIDRLIRERIDAGEQFTVDALAEIQLDTGDANADDFLPVIASLDLTGDAARGAELLARLGRPRRRRQRAGRLLRRVLAHPARRHVRRTARVDAAAAAAIAGSASSARCSMSPSPRGGRTTSSASPGATR